MRSAIEDLAPERGFVVYPGEDRHRVAEGIEAISLADLLADLRATRLPSASGRAATIKPRPNLP
ncbi:MAG TPA: hypothetical protein VHA80_07095 [Solirubrobacterales bacterium]|jgi:hypothetical protein|nr:hypothetical protein [Solirubrobacterales bacterium]